MKTRYYHEAFEYQDEYDYDKLGDSGILVDGERIVCPRCNGEGHHFRNDLDENAMVDSFNEDGDDDGFIAYRRGAFDQRCEECNGKRIVDIPKLPKWAADCINEWEEDRRLDEKIRRAECGYQW